MPCLRLFVAIDLDTSHRVGVADALRRRRRRRAGRPRAARRGERGLAGWGYHARDEYIEIDSIAPRLYLMTRMLQTVVRAP